MYLEKMNKFGKMFVSDELNEVLLGGYFWVFPSGLSCTPASVLTWLWGFRMV